MKKFSKGFTLAEVLVTLAIIGVVAAVTLPTFITDHQYSAVGALIGKFVSSGEDAARAFAVDNGEITMDNFKELMLMEGSALRDGTEVSFGTGGTAGAGYGAAAGTITLTPTIKLPSGIASSYTLVLTKKGFIVAGDGCTQQLYQNHFKSTKSMLEGCKGKSVGGETKPVEPAPAGS